MNAVVAGGRSAVRRILESLGQVSPLKSGLPKAAIYAALGIVYRTTGYRTAVQGNLDVDLVDETPYFLLSIKYLLSLCGIFLVWVFYS